RRGPGAGRRLDPARGQVEPCRLHGDRVRPLDAPGRGDRDQDGRAPQAARPWHAARGRPARGRLGPDRRRRRGRPPVPARSAQLLQPRTDVGLRRRRFAGRGRARVGFPWRAWGPRVVPMLLHVIARGKIGRSPEAELVERYAKRIGWPLKLTELPESGGRIPEPQTPVRTVLLDERGEQLSSASFAEWLRDWRDNGIREARFVIGAADGHAP